MSVLASRLAMLLGGEPVVQPDPASATSSVLGVGDIALSWSNASGAADLVLLDDDLASDRGLTTAVAIALFTDRRAADDDTPPSGDERDRRGWWGDEFADTEGDKIGSRLWLLDRAKRTREVTLLAEQYVREALAWMLEDRVIASLGVTVETQGDGLLFAVELTRPGRDPISFRFAHTWEHQE